MATDNRRPGVVFNALTGPEAMAERARVEKICTGEARALAGNKRFIGRTDGALAPTEITANSLAVIPEQFGPFHSGNDLRPYARQIHGVVGDTSFSGITDVINNKTSPVKGKSTRDGFQQLNPGQLILEIPGARDQGDHVPVTIYVPPAPSCPVGTRLVGTQIVGTRQKP